MKKPFCQKTFGCFRNCSDMNNFIFLYFDKCVYISAFDFSTCPSANNVLAATNAKLCLAAKIRYFRADKIWCFHLVLFCPNKEDGTSFYLSRTAKQYLSCWISCEGPAFLFLFLFFGRTKAMYISSFDSRGRKKFAHLFHPQPHNFSFCFSTNSVASWNMWSVVLLDGQYFFFLGHDKNISTDFLSSDR